LRKICSQILNSRSFSSSRSHSNRISSPALFTSHVYLAFSVGWSFHFAAWFAQDLGINHSTPLRWINSSTSKSSSEFYDPLRYSNSSSTLSLRASHSLHVKIASLQNISQVHVSRRHFVSFFWTLSLMHGNLANKFTNLFCEIPKHVVVPSVMHCLVRKIQLARAYFPLAIECCEPKHARQRWYYNMFWLFLVIFSFLSLLLRRAKSLNFVSFFLSSEMSRKNYRLHTLHVSIRLQKIFFK
jgi:hypothetical protein